MVNITGRVEMHITVTL